MGFLRKKSKEITWDEFKAKNYASTVAKIVDWNNGLNPKFCLQELKGQNLLAVIAMWQESCE